MDTIEDLYTSTGTKFWRHRDQMIEYRFGGHNTMISTHISPTAKCNLKCGYCSVKSRNDKDEIPLEVMIKYVSDLRKRGLRAVIISGGGEPTLHTEFRCLVDSLRLMHLSLGLITNGTTLDPLGLFVIRNFSWVRVSLNLIDGRIVPANIPWNELKPRIGYSLVWSKDWFAAIEELRAFVKENEGRYLRIVPDCTLSLGEIYESFEEIRAFIGSLNAPNTFCQYKDPRAPQANICHQAYFRPYLSEVDGGTVYPCDSVVLNDPKGYFEKKYAICTPDRVLDFIDGKISMPFNPSIDCSRCVFAYNVEMLRRWKEEGAELFGKYMERMLDEEFV